MHFYKLLFLALLSVIVDPIIIPSEKALYDDLSTIITIFDSFLVMVYLILTETLDFSVYCWFLFYLNTSFLYNFICMGNSKSSFSYNKSN